MAEIRPKVTAALDFYVEELHRQGLNVDRVYLYGSQRSGEWHEFSDVDVVVVSDDFADKAIWERAEITGQAGYETYSAFSESIEALAKTPDEIANCHPASFLADVLKDAVIVYDRDRVPIKAKV